MFSSKNYTANAMFECKQETEEQPEEIKRPRLEQWPPPYSELGKRAKNLFTKFYDVGLLKLDISTKTPDNITFSTSTVKNIEQDKMSGSLEAKYEFADGGITAVEKFNTDRILLTEISFKDKILEGLRFSVGEFVNPKTKGAKSVIKAEFKRQKVAMNADFEYDGDKIYQFTASLVLAHQGLVGGFQTKFDFNQSMLTDLSLALGYSNADFILHTSVKGGTDYEGSIYHKVAPNLDAGVDIAWFSNKEETIFGVAGQYEFNENISIRGKVNNVNELGLGFRQKLREGITLTMSCLFNLTSINDGNHKIGLGMQLEA